MTKPNIPPEGIELITRAQLIVQTGVARSKIVHIQLNPLFLFPSPVHTLPHRELAWDKAEVERWLAINDIKKLKVPKRMARHPEKGENKITPLDDKLALLFLQSPTVNFLRKNKRFNGKGKSTKVHIKEENISIKELPYPYYKTGGDHNIIIQNTYHF